MESFWKVFKRVEIFHPFETLIPIESFWEIYHKSSAPLQPYGTTKNSEIVEYISCWPF